MSATHLIFTNKVESFKNKHPKLSKVLFQFIKFYLFSLLVTLVQYLMLTFLPELLYQYTKWSEIPCQLLHIRVGFIDTYVFDFPVTGDATGGMGYFIAFATTLFIAQCINFPVQRNITFKSKGNIGYQILWYVIAFFMITIVCSLLMSIYVPLLKDLMPVAVYNIVITVVNGGIQMVIYFPILKLIFPEE
ncbi:hypothetical protein [Fusibacter bizertensis]|nr:hypothetical protein [Fusibacter bizertensis]